MQRAITSDREAIDRLCGKYVDNVKATTREKVVDAASGSDPDERLMRSIEEKIDIPEARKGDFRHELMNYIAAAAARGTHFDYRENKRLRSALELKTVRGPARHDPAHEPGLDGRRPRRAGEDRRSSRTG